MPRRLHPPHGLPNLTLSHDIRSRLAINTTVMRSTSPTAPSTFPPNSTNGSINGNALPSVTVPVQVAPNAHPLRRVQFPRLQQVVSQQLVHYKHSKGHRRQLCQSIGLEVVPESDHKDDHPSHSGQPSPDGSLEVRNCEDTVGLLSPPPSRVPGHPYLAHAMAAQPHLRGSVAHFTRALDHGIPAQVHRCRQCLKHRHGHRPQPGYRFPPPLPHFHDLHQIRQRDLSTAPTLFVMVPPTIVILTMDSGGDGWDAATHAGVRYGSQP